MEDDAMNKDDMTTNASNRIPMDQSSPRTRFFANPGTDELVSVVLELTAELWTVKERLYVLERAASPPDTRLPDKIEGWQLTGPEQDELAAERQRLIASVLRALDANYAERARVQQQIDGDGAPVGSTDSRAA